MAEIHKSIIHFATELVKYHADKTLGEGALSILVDEVTDFIGEDVTEKISTFLDQGEKAKQVLEAFKMADECFIKNADDHTLQQAIVSQPFAGIEHLEKIALQIPSTLDDQGLLKTLRDQFEQDWPNRLSRLP